MFEYFIDLFGITDVNTNTLFVSHNGDDFDKCGNRTVPCRTVRHAVKMVGDGGQIYIDYAQGTPYMECEKMRQSTYSIQMAKSLSLHGINGKAKITCTKGYGLFNISSPNTNISSVKFFNLVISNSDIAVRLDIGTRSRIVFQNVLIKNNEIAIYTKHSNDCFIVIINSTFENNFSGAGTRLECLNVTAEIISSTFTLTPALFANIGDKPQRWQSMRVWVRDAVIDSKKFQMCTDMFAIKLSAAIVNITISNSQIKNHVTNCKDRDISALRVYGHQSSINISSHILLSNVLIENNHNNWSTLTLDAVFSGFVKIMIQDSIFRNNTAALRLDSNYGRMATFPKVFLENNTFVDNIYEGYKPNGAAAIYFSRTESHVSACRFLDNKAGKNPYTGVLTISESARVTFSNTYFENRQTNVHSNQLYALGNQPLRFTGHTTINLVALKRRQSVFIHIPTGVSTGVIVSKNFKILCPRSYKLTLKRFCLFEKTVNVCHYLNVECEQCPTKTYTVERGELIFNKTNNIQCQQCPRGGDCDDGLIKAKPNFWGYKTKMKIHFIQCPPGYCCKPKECTTYDCCCGNRSGTLCGQCSQGMSETLFSTHCISNTKCSLNYFFIFGMTGFVALYLIFFLYHREIVNLLKTSLFTKPLSFFTRRRTVPRSNNNTSGNSSSSGGIIKIFFYYYQVCHLIRGSVGPSKHSEIITSAGDAISRTMNMVIINLSSFGCPLKNLRPISKAVILHSVGYCLLGLLCVLYVLRKLFMILRKRKRNKALALQYVTSRANQDRRASKPSFSQRMVSAFTYIFLLMYASSAQLSLSLLYCVPIRGDQVLFLDGNIKCYQSFQYFLFAYMISSILPFCLVPVLSSYHLKFGRIGVKQFCVACIFPLPLCCFWMYLLLKNSRCRNQGTSNTTYDNNQVGNEHGNNNTESFSGERFAFDNNEPASAILCVLLGPFRSHHALMCFPASRIPWEGFLIFRRLALIIVFTFIYDIQLRMFLALTVCVAILIIHTFVHPFQRKRDNILETFSLGAHVVLCASNLIKAFYYGEDYSFSKRLPVLNVVESLLVVAPLSVIIIVVIICIIVNCAFACKFCVFLFIRCTTRVFTSI